jgi:hypothetical protein
MIASLIKEVAKMKKVQITAVFWTLLLAVPLSAIALSVLAYTTENLTRISTAVYTFSRDITAGGRGLVLEIAQRWPEVAGMIVGQIVIMLIFLVVRKDIKNKSKENP